MGTIISGDTTMCSQIRDLINTMHSSNQMIGVLQNEIRTLRSELTNNNAWVVWLNSVLQWARHAFHTIFPST